MRTNNQYAVCIANTGYPASLEVRKIYQILPAQSGDEPGFLRVIDESGEDYLLPEGMFVAIDLPREANSAFRSDCNDECRGRPRK